MVFQVLNQFGHRLLCHLSPLGEEADRCSGVIEVLEDHTVCRTHHAVALLRQPSDDEVVHSNERLSHQDRKVGGGLSASHSWYSA